MPFDGRPGREPMFNAPWPVLALVGALAAAFAVQLFLPMEQVARLALSAEGLRQGLWYEPVTYLFLHGGFGHLAMNGFAALAFGPPVLRFMRRWGRGAGRFYIFFLVCGIVAGLGHLVLDWAAPSLLIGASGAISGLWGAASRLMGRGGDLAPVVDRAVMGQAFAFALINVLIGFLGVFAGLFIGWQAHIVGYAAGLLLIGPFVRAGRAAG